MLNKLPIKTIFFTLLIFIVFIPKGFNSISSSGNSAEKKWESYVNTLYNSIKGDKSHLKFEVFNKALIGYYNLKSQHKLSDKNLLSIVDFSIISNQKRLWIINIATRKVLYHSLVSHGKNTGSAKATNFSNGPETHKSSLGFYVTGSTYFGKHDLSLRLMGMDSSFNCNAFDRAIVMHGAKYVSEDWIKKYGMLGRSFGCPAIPVEISKEVINLLSNGTCLFLYYPDKDYEKKSTLLDKNLILATLNGFDDNLVDYHLN